MTPFSYTTIQLPAEGIYKEKGSKFLAFAFPVASEEDIRESLEALRKKYYDARHHCYAYMLGADKKKFRAFDDGEPNHSAGDPILGQIRSKGITNVLIVVVRYFGGVKLGVGGLITAYKTAAEDALNNSVVVEKEVTQEMTFSYDYALTPDMMKLVKEFDLKILDQKFEGDCFLKISYSIKHEVQLAEKIIQLGRKGLKKN